MRLQYLFRTLNYLQSHHFSILLDGLTSQISVVSIGIVNILQLADVTSVVNDVSVLHYDSRNVDTVCPLSMRFCCLLRIFNQLASLLSLPVSLDHQQSILLFLESVFVFLHVRQHLIPFRLQLLVFYFHKSFLILTHSQPLQVFVSFDGMTYSLLLFLYAPLNSLLQLLAFIIPLLLLTIRRKTLQQGNLFSVLQQEGRLCSDKSTIVCLVKGMVQLHLLPLVLLLNFCQLLPFAVFKLQDFCLDLLIKLIQRLPFFQTSFPFYSFLSQPMVILLNLRQLVFNIAHYIEQFSVLFVEQLRFETLHLFIVEPCEKVCEYGDLLSFAKLAISILVIISKCGLWGRVTKDYTKKLLVLLVERRYVSRKQLQSQFVDDIELLFYFLDAFNRSQVCCQVVWPQLYFLNRRCRYKRCWLLRSVAHSLECRCKHISFIMSYEKTIEILKEDKGFDYFLTLDQQELEELLGSLSTEDEKKIIDFLRDRNHTPRRKKKDVIKPAFLQRVRETHQSIAFSDPRKEILTNYKQQPGFIIARKNHITVEEDSYNYPYYSVVRGMLMTLLDKQPQPETIKMMHSQLQSLFKGIIQPNLIHGLELNQSTRKGSYLLFSKPRRKTTRLDLSVIKKYLSQIFQKEYRCFREFMAGSRKLMSAIDDQNLDEIANQASEQSEDEESVATQTDTFTDRYFLERTKDMSEQQFEQYSENRTLNFTMNGNEKLSLFVDARNLLLHRYTNKQIFKLISFILCRSLQQIVFRIINQKFGQVKPVKNFTVDLEDVRRVGNEYLDRVAKRAKTYALKFSTYLTKARNLFREEFHEMGYDEIYSKHIRIKLIKKGGDIEEDFDHTEAIWQRSRNLRKMWFQRIQAQAQFHLHSAKKSQPTSYLNDYARLIFARKEDYQKVGPAAFFKQYFLKEDVEKPVEIPTGKLQSLFD